jgi:gp32 DNA binding protein like
MSNSFANLKRQSQAGNLDKLAQKVKELDTSSGKDNTENYWKLEQDKAGNGHAVIRFLPAPPVDGDDALPWVKYFSHGFESNGGWYIENCPTTKGDGTPCPACQENTQLWATGVKANQDIVRNRKRKLNYVANIYIVNDPKHPENNGTVKLFRFGKSIFEMITEAMNPVMSDEKPFNPFDLWTGANLKLRIRRADNYPKYDKSTFDSPGPLTNDDEEMEKIYKSEHSLVKEVDDSKFKTYEQLKARVDKVLGTGSSTPRTTVEQAKALNPKPKKVEEDATDEVEDDDMAYFAKLADDDIPF